MKSSNVIARICGALLVIAMMAPAVSAHEYKAGGMIIDHPWARPSIGTVKNGAAYFVLDNLSDTDDRLVSIKTDIAARAEIHETVMKDGYAKMAAIQGGLAVPKNSKVALAPRGKHVMLFGLKQKLEDGQSFPMTLVFEKSGEVAVVVKIETPKDAGEAVDHSKHGGGGKKMDHSHGHDDDRGS